MKGAHIKQGEDADGRIYAAVDASAHDVTGQVARSRLAAFLTPFQTIEAARDALSAAGALVAGA